MQAIKALVLAENQLDNYQKISHFRSVPDSSTVQQQHLHKQTNKHDVVLFYQLSKPDFVE